MLSRFFRRRRWDAERSRELDSYLQIETDENIARGLSPEEARYAARRKLGNPTLIREEIYVMNSPRFLEPLWQDLRYGMRALRLNPGFAAVALLSLALGIGANTAIFQLLDAVRLRMLPVNSPQELAEVRLPSQYGTTGNFMNWHSELTNALWEQLRDHRQAFSGVFAWAPDDFNLAPRGEVHLVHGIWVSGDFFSTLGVQPILGRTFTPADDRRGCGAGPGVVVSYSFWQRELGGDPSAIGKRLTIDYHPVEVLGVMPASFFGLDVGHSFDVALPICSQPVLGGEDNYLDTRYDWWLTVMRLRSTPGVDAAAETAIVPTEGSSVNRTVWMDGADSSQAKSPWFNFVSPDFFRTMGTPLLSGRDFNDRDTPTSPKVAIVNEAFVRQFTNGANPVGRKIFQKTELREPQVEYEIVGLVSNTKYQDLREEFPPLVYVPSSQGGLPDPIDQILIRSQLPLAELTARLKQTIAEASPDIAIQFRSLQTMIHDELLSERLMATLSGFFGFLAALLAIIGLYGVMSYMVVRRTNEIGIRMTLGAGRGEIVAMIVREAGLLLAVGLVFGIAMSLAGGKAAGSLLFGLKPYDPMTLALAAVLLALVAVAASYLPARRAARLEPMIALREE